MKTLRIFILVGIILTTLSVLFAQEYSQKDLDDLNKISRLIGKEIDEDTLKYIETTSKAKNIVVSAIAFTSLYVNNQKKYQDSFYDTFSINDYSEREKGNYNFLPMEALAEMLQEVETKAKGDEDDQRILLLMTFMNVKDENLWIQTPDGNISISRFIRGMYFASSLKSLKIDPAKEADKIDAYTKKKNIT